MIDREMEGARFTGVGEPLRITRLPLPKVRPGWALVRVRAVAICGSDVHILDGHTQVGFTPITLGHEIAGDVVEVDGAAIGIDVGDRVFVNPIVGCGTCSFCCADERNLCPGRTLLGIGMDGGMAEYVTVPIANLTALPERIAYPEIAMIESAGTAHHALRASRAQAGDALMVLGAGGLGLQVLRIAHVLGLRAVGVDTSPAARARAIAAGAELAFSPEEIAERVATGTHREIAEELGSSFGFAHAVDCVGSEETMNLALHALRPGGSCSVIGINAESVRLPDPAVFVRRSLQVRGIYTYTDADIARVIDLMISGGLRLLDSVSRTLPLASAGEGFDAFMRDDSRPVRVVLEP